MTAHKPHGLRNDMIGHNLRPIFLFLYSGVGSKLHGKQRSNISRHIANSNSTITLDLLLHPVSSVQGQLAYQVLRSAATMTSANGTFTWCGPDQGFSLNFTCTGPSCINLDSFPDSTCTSDGTTLSCTNGVVCPGPTNYTSDFAFSQSNVIVAQTQHIVLPDLCADIVVTSDGTTGGTKGTLTSTGPCGFGNSTTSDNSTTSTSTSTTSLSTAPSSLPASSSSSLSSSLSSSSSLANSSSYSLTLTSSSLLTSLNLHSTPSLTTTTPSTTPSGSGSWTSHISSSAPPTSSWTRPRSGSLTYPASAQTWTSGMGPWLPPPPERTTCTEGGWLGGPSFSVDSPKIWTPSGSGSASIQEGYAWSHWLQEQPSVTPSGSATLSTPGSHLPVLEGTSAVPPDGWLPEEWSSASATESGAGWGADQSSVLVVSTAIPAVASSTLPIWTAAGTEASATGSGWASPMLTGIPESVAPTSAQSRPNSTFPGNAMAPVSSFKGAASPRLSTPKALWCTLLICMFFIHSSTALEAPFKPDLTPTEDITPRSTIDLILHERKLASGWKTFANDLSEYLSGKITSGEFADNLIAEAEDAVCDHAAGVVVTKALGVDLVEVCVEAITVGNLLVAPEAEFAVVLGAGILCNLLVAEALPALGKITENVAGICKEKKPCSESLLTDPNNCGSCGNVCPAGTTCANGACTSNSCTGQTCDTFGPCGPGGSCVCASTTESTGFCVDGSTPCAGLASCVDSSNCASGEICAVGSCCGENVCVGATFCGGGNGTALTSRSLLWRTLKRGEVWEGYGKNSIGGLGM